jgi:hypothetical protein
MGTNLSQVFVANTDVLETGTTFNGTVTFPEIGIWNLAGNSGAGAYVNTALYALGVDTTDEVAGATTSEVTDNLTTIANPVWLFNRLQFVQVTPNFNPIATPIINTTNIKRIKYDPYTASAGHKQVLTGTPASSASHTVKFIFRTTPLDQLNFHDPNGTGLVDLSGDRKVFPLGAFNTTNHKVISVELPKTDSNATLAEFCALLDDAVEAHVLLNDLIKVSTTTAADDTYTARHAGVVFDMIIWNNTADAASALVVTTTGLVVGVGNAWQVLGDEIKCRSRYGNFNRMYLPQNMPTFTNTTAKYDKITIQYEHNWPTATGIAPAGTLNEVVLYYTDADYTAPAAGDTADNSFENAFVYTIATAKEFLW